MYEGIIEDVEHVKEVLASHGHNSVDKNLVFELLAEQKVTDRVVAILLGHRVRHNQTLNSFDNSWGSDRSLPLEEAVTPRRPDNSVYLSATVEDSSSSDDLEVVEHNVPPIEPVDLTIEEIQSEEVIKTTAAAASQSIIDLTTDNQAMEVENSRLVEPKAEDLASDSATDSEVEMEEDYYQRRPYIESEDSEGFGESDEKLSPLPSPILAQSPIIQNRGSSLEEAGENQLEEMLEENNNDPNNNLEDIEVLEQNNGNCGMTTENLNIVKEMIARTPSPKPGCSKDSYYTDNDCCTGSEAGREPKVADSLMVDVLTVQKIFPSFTEDQIVAALMENHEAVNRVQIAVWELMPEEKPAPIYLAKRKPQEDVCPSPMKKFASEDSSSPEKKGTEAATAPAKSNIVKPAKLTILECKTGMLIPSKLTVPLKPVSMIPNRKSSLTLKPSKLEHLKPQYSVNIVATKAKETEAAAKKEPANSVEAKIFESFHKLDQVASGKADSESKEAREALLIRRLHESNEQVREFPPKPKPQTDFMSLKVGKGGENFTKLDVKKNDAIPKEDQGNKEHLTDMEKRLAEIKTFLCEPLPSREGQTWMDTNSQSLGAIKKQTAIQGAEIVPGKIVIEKRDTAWRAPGKNGALADHQRPEKPLNRFTTYISHNSKNYRQPMDLTGLKTISSAALGSRPRSVSPILQRSELTVGKLVNLEIPAAVASSSASNAASGRVRPRDFAYWRTFETETYDLLGSTAAAGPASVQPGKLPSWKDFERHPYVDILAPEPVAAPVLNPAAPARDQPRELPIWTNFAAGPYDDINAGVLERVDQMHLMPQQHVGAAQPDNGDAAKREKRKPEQSRLPIIQHVGEQLQALAPPPNNEMAAAGAQGFDRVEPLQPRADGPPPKELFNPLINMFPDVDPIYISGLCITAKARNQTLESLVEILLIDGTAHPRIINPEPEPAELNVDAQYETLKEIFPNAHPEYLRKMAEEYYRDPEAMKNFVQAKLENPDYPTMADYQKKIKITEQIQQYTVDFSPQKFLEIFPNPFAHFENPKRVHRYNVVAFEFLKFHFRMNKVLTVQRAYRSPEHVYHPSLAAKSLEIIGPDMKSKRIGKPLPTEDIPLLQEFAFIRHKAVIKEYMQAQKRQEKEEFQRLKMNNELLECQCCFDDECMPSKCLTCTEGHIFCKSCIKLGTATKIGEGQTQFPCFVECEGEFALPILQKVLEPTMFSILLRKRQEEEVKAAGLEGLVSCPFCHFASIPPPEDKVFKCLNPECMKETCRLCKELNHVPLRCDEVIKGEEARHYLEEKMTEALVRKCYKCARPFFKVEGCNKMTCPCGAMTCYICGEPVRDYKHFNGQGSDRTDLCPLWSDNQMLNAQSVRAVAEAAQQEIRKKNPNLKIDATALMPSLPQASRGPHQDIANAHVLPVHARRV